MKTNNLAFIPKNMKNRILPDLKSRRNTGIFKINKVPVDISDEKSNINNLSTLALEAKLAVVVFDQQKEWAELFTQEIWKKIGGVSSGIPILLIGTNSNEPSKISIPNVTLAEAGKELLSLEIKIQYDSLTEK